MAKHFFDCVFMRDYLAKNICLARVSLKNLSNPIQISNSLRRAMIDNVETYAIDASRIKYKQRTGPWVPEIITEKLRFLPLNQDFFKDKDHTMLEFHFLAKNTSNVAYHVYAGQMTIRNKETNKEYKIEEVMTIPMMPFSQLGPDQTLEFVAQINKASPYQLERKGIERISDHQAAMVSHYYDHAADTNPAIMRWTITLHHGMKPKNLIVDSFSSLLELFKTARVALENRNREIINIQLNKNYRYNISFMGFGDTIGNLISSWISRHDNKIIIGYSVQQSPTILVFNFGVNRLLPKLLGEQKEKKPLLSLSEFKKRMDPKLELKQREESIQIFITHMKRIENYLNTLLEDFKKAKFKEISIKEHQALVKKERQESLERKKKLVKKEMLKLINATKSTR